MCAAAYLYVFPYFPAINNPNENVRFYMTAAIVEQGTYEIDEMRSRWGWVNDAALHHGRVFSVKAPGTSLLGVPGYALYYYGNQALDAEPDREVGLWVCRVTASILPTLAFLFFFYGWLDRETRHPVARDAVFLSVALGSMLFGYALLFVSHTLSACVAFGAFMILREARRLGTLDWKLAAWAGFLAASVTALEYPGFVVSATLAIYALLAIRPRGRLLHFALGALVPTLMVMHFQWSAFDNPFSPGHLYVESDAFREAHEQGLFGATGFHADAALTLLFDLGSGLFPLTPILVFAVIGFPRLLGDRAHRLDAAVALLCVGLTYLLICFMNNWRGGWTIGPRYLAVVVPFVAWGALSGLDLLSRTHPRLVAILALGTAITALLTSGIPSVYYPHLPPEFTRPLPELFAPLVAHDYAPPNAGNLLGWWGTASMLPMLALAGVALLWAVHEPQIDLKDRFSIVVGGLLIGGFLTGPHMQSPERDRPVADAVAFVTRSWNPQGHDLAARLEAHIATSSAVTPEDYRQLADVYFAEGREREARAAMHAGDLASEAARLRDERGRTTGRP